jgi:hypothetical protein
MSYFDFKYSLQNRLFHDFKMGSYVWWFFILNSHVMGPDY